jgi:hypothetical protein
VRTQTREGKFLVHTLIDSKEAEDSVTCTFADGSVVADCILIAWTHASVHYKTKDGKHRMIPESPVVEYTEPPIKNGYVLSAEGEKEVVTSFLSGDIEWTPIIRTHVETQAKSVNLTLEAVVTNRGQQVTAELALSTLGTFRAPQYRRSESLMMAKSMPEEEEEKEEFRDENGASRPERALSFSLGKTTLPKGSNTFLLQEPRPMTCTHVYTHTLGRDGHPLHVIKGAAPFGIPKCDLYVYKGKGADSITDRHMETTELRAATEGSPITLTVGPEEHIQCTSSVTKVKSTVPKQDPEAVRSVINVEHKVSVTVHNRTHAPVEIHAYYSGRTPVRLDGNVKLKHEQEDSYFVFTAAAGMSETKFRFDTEQYTV